MKIMINKNYVNEEGIFVTYHTLEALYQKYCNNMPKHIEDKVLQLIVEIKEFLDYKKIIKMYKKE